MNFRTWLVQLRRVRGERPLWPVLLGATLDAEFRRQRAKDECYKREVFKNRDNHLLKDGKREEHLVARLYHSSLAQDGIVLLDNQRVWLLGFQWPTQGGYHEKKRQADLVGMTADGGLVVFEAKRETGDPPLIAIMEGLDYLACLLRPRNFEKIKSGFETWLTSRKRPIPVGFEGTIPDQTVRPTLIILAPPDYFAGRYSRSIRGKDWPLIADIGESFMESVILKFAATDFSTPVLQKPTFPKKK